MRKMISVLSLVLSINTTQAQEVANSNETNSIAQNTIVNSTQVGNAEEWGLTAEEWSRYLHLMQGPESHWYSKLSPPEILGLEAQNDQEQKHFAEIVAKTEHDHLARELAFDQAVHKAVLKLYANEPVVKSFNLSPFNPIQKSSSSYSQSLQKGDHIAFFTDLKNGSDFVTMPRLTNFIKNKTGVILDIYSVGNVDDNTIRQWAKLNQVPIDLVSQGRITLNHDNGKLQKIAGQVTPPYILLIRNGESKPISVWSLS